MTDNRSGVTCLPARDDGARPLFAPALCLLFADDDGSVEPGRQAVAYLARGQILARAPGQVLPWLRAEERPRPRCRILLVDTEATAARALVATPAPRFRSRLVDDAAARTAAQALWEAAAHDAPARQLQKLVAALLPRLLDESADWRAPILTRAVAEVRELLHAHFAEELRLDALAATVATSKCHLVHLFREEMGLPPHAYQIQLRIAHARRLLRAGTPPTDVARQTGFADQSHLTRHFKRIVGLPPGRYAAVIRRCETRDDVAARAPAESSPSPRSPARMIDTWR